MSELDAPRRDPYVDLARSVAIVIVVIGHWATTTVLWEGNAVRNVNALSDIAVLRPVTWLVQVMPVVFFIGGFANARSLAAHDGGALGYLKSRLGRLMVPTALFLAVWQVLGLLIERISRGSSGQARAAESAALPLWFLGIYLVVVALAPVMWRLHRRFGAWVMGALAAGVGAVDLVSIGFGLGDLGGVNYALVWLFAHQAGFWYADGTLQRWGRSAATAIAVFGLAALVALTVWGGYPVSLVGVPGQVRSNAQPPSLAMLAGVVWLVGLVMVLRPAGLRALQGRAGRAFVRAVHPVILTAFLWHVSALSAGAAAWRALGLPEPAIGSAGWWALRPVWVVVIVVPFLGLLAVFRWFEVHPGGGSVPGSPLRTAAAGFGVFSMAIGVLGYGETGFIPFAPDPGELILMFRFTPLQNVAHLALGAAAVAGAFSRRRPWQAAALGAAAFVAVGVLEGWASRFGMDDFTATAHVAAGAAALAGICVAGLVELLGRSRLSRRP
jgi:fucose 4-O-acetylase-like acetyltransferase